MTMANLEDILVLGLSTRTVEKKGSVVYYSITELGSQALELLDQEDPWTGVVGNRMLVWDQKEFKLTGERPTIPRRGFRFVEVPIEINDWWYDYFQNKIW